MVNKDFQWRRFR